MLGMLLLGSLQAALAPVQQKAMNWVNKTPVAATKTTESLGKYLGGVSADEYTRALTVFSWIAKNIRYDYQSLKNSQNGGTMAPQDAEAVLQRRSGVCAGYASLMKATGTAAGLQCEEIIGYSKGGTYYTGKVFERTTHAWNAIQIFGKWELMDATWASPDDREQDLNYLYFCASPRQLLSSHLPLDNKWQLVSKPIDLDAFSNSPWVHSSFHAQRFERASPMVSTLISNAKLQTIYLTKAFAEESVYEVNFVDEKDVRQELALVVKTTATGVALQFTLPANSSGTVEILARNDIHWFQEILNYRVASVPQAVATN